MDMAQRALDHPLSRRPGKFLQEIFLQGARIDPDTNGYFTVGGDFDYLLNAPAGANVAGIEAKPIHALFQSDHGELIVEMDVGDERNADLLSDFSQFFRRLPHRHGDPDD